jgi:general secretion pathway protein G
MKPFPYVICGLIAIGGVFYWHNTLRTPPMRAFFDGFEPAFNAFKEDFGRYPSNDEGLRVLYEKPPGFDGKWQKYMLGDYADMRDRWGREFGYRNPGVRNPQSYDFFSYGPDGVLSADDIGNWR